MISIVILCFFGANLESLSNLSKSLSNLSELLFNSSIAENHPMDQHAWWATQPMDAFNVSDHWSVHRHVMRKHPFYGRSFPPRKSNSSNHLIRFHGDESIDHLSKFASADVVLPSMMALSIVQIRGDLFITLPPDIDICYGAWMSPMSYIGEKLVPHLAHIVKHHESEHMRSTANRFIRQWRRSLTHADGKTNIFCLSKIAIRKSFGFLYRNFGQKLR
jgi:hypothetical protein